METSIKGKTVIVTGASKGIGKGIATVFAKHGANVALAARDTNAAKECAKEISSYGFHAEAFHVDVKSKESTDSLVQEVVHKFGKIDILCANAGIFPSCTIDQMKLSDWENVMNTNVRGTLFSLQSCLPYLKKVEFGRVIITSSITGPVTGYSGWAHYGASKAAQLGFMRTAALELAPFNITINAVMPGNIVTEGLEGLGSEYLERMAASIPLKRLGSVEDIGYAALFLASREAGFITGQTITIDGGQTLPENIDAMV